MGQRPDMPSSSAAGYSGRPLSAKLGMKPGMRCWRLEMPDAIAAVIDSEVAGLDIISTPSAGLDAAHIFLSEADMLKSQLSDLRTVLHPDGMIWVSWPKKASKVPSSVTEDVVRAICLPMGLVDVKVCAVDTIWSGLKLVIRKELRSEQARKLAAGQK